MKVKSDDRTIENVLTASFLRVPRFQRPYEWTGTEVEELWEDIIGSPTDYFIGSIVVFPSTHGASGIVDGQQRLTTLTLLLCAVRDGLRSTGLADDEAKGLQNLIERRSVLDNAQHYVLQIDETSEYFKHVQSGLAAAAPIESKPELHLAAAHRKLISLVETYATGTPRARAKKLKDLRSKVLGLKLVHIEVDNEDDATVIFQTLNSRGRDLQAADLVKSHLLSLLKTKNPGHDLARDTWNKMRGGLADAKVDIPMDRFLAHSWLSRYEYIAQANLGRSVRKNVKRASAQPFLESLVLDARLYREISEPTFRASWQQEEQPIVQAFDALQIFRVRQPMPWVLALWRAYASKDLRQKDVIPAIVAIEKFHFLATAVASQPSSGGVSKMYATHAQRLTDASTIEGRRSVIKSLSERLSDPGRLPTLDEFTAGFLEIRLSKKYQQQARLARYILERLVASEPAATPDFKLLTVEHIAPQSGLATSAPEEDAARLGNLLLLPQLLNAELDSRSFRDKKMIFNRAVKEGVPVDPRVRAAKAWGSDEITARTRRMAEAAYTSVWAL